ncbi:MAG: cyclophilin-like fold protein [Planctomycetota bacterium]|nr:cyclophilin-like fold protein [Planctomycetota bacterium]MEE2990571.1 cyclophilin-like fold protein [Planctomycetota bacterium]
MSTPIIITVGDVELSAELNDSSTARQVITQLPFDAHAHRWGDEFYFSIPVDHAAETDAREEMAIGELAYWPPGNAFCIFFGPTPVSCGSEPRAANPCNPLGQILDDIAPLLEAQDGVNVQVHLA